MDMIRRNLSRFRNELKGLAILWVVFFHAQLGLDGAVYQVQRIGYGGVDVFFFLSGFGLFYSLEKDADLGRYLKRRGERLLPSYLPFCLIWLICMVPAYGQGLATSIRMAAGNLSMLGFLTGGKYYINWYTGALLISLLLAPFFHAVLRPGKQYWLRCAALMAVLFGVGLGYIDDSRYMLISRLPVFALGMVAGGCVISPRMLKWTLAALAAGALAAVAALYLCLNRYQELLVDYAMYWHPFVLIAPALCIALSAVMKRLPLQVLGPVRYLGEASFEIFLFNAWVEVLGVKLGWFATPVEWLLASAASIVVGCVYHALVEYMLQKKNGKILKKG